MCLTLTRPRIRFPCETDRRTVPWSGTSAGTLVAIWSHSDHVMVNTELHGSWLPPEYSFRLFTLLTAYSPRPVSSPTPSSSREHLPSNSPEVPEGAGISASNGSLIQPFDVSATTTGSLCA